MKEAWNKIVSDQPATWIGHAYVTAMAPVAVSVAAWLWFQPDPGIRVITYLVGVFLLAAFYATREMKDEVTHRYILKDYDKAEGVITPRLDKVGDSFGPFLTFIVSVTTASLMWHYWWIPAAIFVACTVGLIRAFAKIVRRK